MSESNKCCDTCWLEKVPFGVTTQCLTPDCPCHSTTPDTEWGAKTFRENLERVCKYAETNYCPGCGLTPEGLDQLLTSRDTYWKEQLQNARIDWLRSEIEKLEGMKDYPHLCESSEGIECEYNQALTSIITRYKEELLELDKTNGF